MKKNLIALAVAATMAAPLAAQAGDDLTTDVSGFVDIIGTNYGDGGAGSNAFGADGEVDFSATQGAVTVRIDADLRLDGTSGQLEQAFFAWGAMDALTVIGGVFNNPIGQEAEDAPNLNFTSHSAIWNILDGATALNGNNIAGVAVAGGTDMFTGTLAVLNDIGHATKTDGTMKNSIAAVLNANLMENLDLELGYVTQDAGAGNVLDFNAEYDISSFTLGLDFLMADKIVDNAYNLWAGFNISDNAVVKARYEAVSLAAAGADTPTKITLHGAYGIADNLTAALEFSKGDLGNNLTPVAGIIDDTTIMLEFIGVIGDFK